MSDRLVNFGDAPAIVSFSNIFRYKGLTFEWHNYMGPMPLKKNLEPSNAKPSKKFYEITAEWNKLTKKKKEKTRIHG